MGCLSFFFALALLGIAHSIFGFEFAVLVGIAWLLMIADNLSVGKGDTRE